MISRRRTGTTSATTTRKRCCRCVCRRRGRRIEQQACVEACVERWAAVIHAHASPYSAIHAPRASSPPPPTPLPCCAPQHMSVPQLIDTILINPTVHVSPSYRDTGALRWQAEVAVLRWPALGGR